VIPATQIERVPASELTVGDIYAKTKHGPTWKVLAIAEGPVANYITLLSTDVGGLIRRIRPRHTTNVWRQAHE